MPIVQYGIRINQKSWLNNLKLGRPARDKSDFPERSRNISITTLVYEPTLWHPNQDSPEDDVEGGGVLKENLEAEEGEELQLTSPILDRSDPWTKAGGSSYAEDQGRLEKYAKKMEKNLENPKNQACEVSSNRLW